MGPWESGFHFWTGMFWGLPFFERKKNCKMFAEETSDITDDDGLPDWAIDFSELRFTYKM